MEGDCGTAEQLYNAWCKTQKTTDRTIEKQIAACKNGKTTPQNYTETAFGISMKMVYVEGGTFTMGCTGEQGGWCHDDEYPARQTTVSSFYIGMLEVTQSQWKRVMGTNLELQRYEAGREDYYGVGPDYPMYYVSWYEANEFCAQLSRQTGKTYRLPTEAEWEYAARGGKYNECTRYSGSMDADEVAWHFNNSDDHTHVCGTLRANALGIYDMSGNVWEWCKDWFGSYSSNDTDNPRGPSSGTLRVCRGGGWLYYEEGGRVSFRSGFNPSDRDESLGFRVVMAP